MPLVPDFRTSLEILKDHLETKFSGVDSPVGFAVDVVLLEAEQGSAEQVGNACIVLSGVDEKAENWGRFARKATVSARCQASDFSGAMVGAANPDAAQEVLARELFRIIEEDYAVLRDLGLMGNEIAKRPGGFTNPTTTTANQMTPAMAFADTTISFVFLTQEG